MTMNKCSPHISRLDVDRDVWGSGSSSYEKRKHNMSIYWNGVHFKWTILGEDIKTTPFGQKWLDIMESQEDMRIRRKPMFEGMFAMNRHELSHSLSVIEGLAPPGREAGMILSDYYHTPSYTLHFATEDGAEDACVKVLEGPKEIRAHNLGPCTMNTFDIPNSIPHIQTSELHIAEYMPGFVSGCKVFMTDGTTAQFEPSRCNAVGPRFPAKHGFNRNVSFDTMAFHFLVTELGISDSLRVPRLLPVVEEDGLLAGILTTIEGTQKLVASERLIHATDKHAEWKGQLRRTIETLHEHGIALNGIAPFNVLIDDEDEVWLSGVSGHEVVEDGRRIDDLDFPWLDLMFDTWLKDEQLVDVADVEEDSERREKQRIMRWSELARQQREKANSSDEMRT